MKQLNIFQRLLLIVTAWGMGMVELAAQAPDDAGLINITTLEQLNAVRYDLDGDGIVDQVADLDKYNDTDAPFTPTQTTCAAGCQGYELRNNLDFNDAASYAGEVDEGWSAGENSSGTAEGGWVPIGNYNNRFVATFEGNGYTISNLYIRSPLEYVGLFGYCVGSVGPIGPIGPIGPGRLGEPASVNEIRNLGIENESVTGTSHAVAVGGLVGTHSGGQISACYTTGSVTGTSHAAAVGGLVGSDLGGTISACYSTGSVTGGDRAFVGGLVGGNFGGTISACYTTGNVRGGDSASVGGLVGRNAGEVHASYARGAEVNGSGSSLDGLVGINAGVVVYSYFDHNISNRTDTDTGAKTTSDLKTGVTYEGIYKWWYVLDEEDRPYWSLCANSEYPLLLVDFNRDGTPSVAEFGTQGTCSGNTLSVDGSVDLVYPISGEIGSEITIRGRGFPRTSSNSSVVFPDNVPVTEGIVVSSSKLKILVPPGAVTGRIKIILNGAELTSGVFTVVNTPPPPGGPGFPGGHIEGRVAALEVSQTTQDILIASLETRLQALEARGITFNVPQSEGDKTRARVYPNPTAQVIRFKGLSAGSRYSYALYTIGGRKALAGNLDRETINIEKLSAGQYILLLQDDRLTEVIRESIVIE